MVMPIFLIAHEQIVEYIKAGKVAIDLDYIHFEIFQDDNKDTIRIIVENYGYAYDDENDLANRILAKIQESV